jgi:hypothetical protein
MNILTVKKYIFKRFDFVPEPEERLLDILPLHKTRLENYTRQNKLIY